MSENKAERIANKYLKYEMIKRWDVSRTRSDGCWIAYINSEKLLSLSIRSYSSKDVNILRLTDRYYPYRCQNHKKFSCLGRCFESAKPKNRFADLELTFYADEIEKILPWGLDNYFQIDEISDLIDEESLNLHQVEIGKAPGYLWTKLAKEKLRDLPRL